MLLRTPKFKPTQRVRFQTADFSGSGVISSISTPDHSEPVYYIAAENNQYRTYEVSENQIFGLDKGLLLG